MTLRRTPIRHLYSAQREVTAVQIVLHTNAQILSMGAHSRVYDAPINAFPGLLSAVASFEYIPTERFRSFRLALQECSNTTPQVDRLLTSKSHSIPCDHSNRGDMSLVK
jgi:hypothetical protein